MVHVSGNILHHSLPEKGTAKLSEYLFVHVSSTSDNYLQRARASVTGTITCMLQFLVIAYQLL